MPTVAGCREPMMLRRGIRFQARVCRFEKLWKYGKYETYLAFFFFLIFLQNYKEGDTVSIFVNFARVLGYDYCSQYRIP